MNLRYLGLLCVAVLGITLSLGLWPFHVPANDAGWLPGIRGLEFHRNGVIWSRGGLGLATLHDGSSIEVWAEPDHWSSSATVLSLYVPRAGLVVRLRQSLTDLEVSMGGLPSSDDGRARLVVEEAFSPALRSKKPVVVTVASGLNGTHVYVNGLLTAQSRTFRVPDQVLTGRLIVGDSPGQPDGFRGTIRGIAIYGVDLDGMQAMRHYRAWLGSGSPDAVPEDHNLALYRFYEGSGTTIHNDRSGGVDLEIPPEYAVVDKIALEPFWKEFDFSQSYWRGNLKNIVGLIPLGFFFCAFGYVSGMRRPVLATIAAGTLVSLLIEAGQIFLPMRDSGTTDLITNTLGTYLGTLCYNRVYPIIVRRFPRLGWFAKRESSLHSFIGTR